MSDRYHRAARDGYLDLLKEATRKDCNSRDDDGMTPTLWAAFEGNLDALRLLIGRGGDPEKCDHYGNAGLHFAAARGHMNCVSFLVNYGVNLWAKDIDQHTATELAAMNDRHAILRFLDDQVAKEERANPKKVKSLKEKANKEAEKRIKEFSQVQEKARKLAEKEKKRLEKERRRMESTGYATAPAPASDGADAARTGPRPSMVALEIRRDSRLIYSDQKTKFSELVGTTRQKEGRPRIPGGAVFKKVQQQQKRLFVKAAAPNSTLTKSVSSGYLDDQNDADFKVGAIEDGKRSVRSLSGLRRDSEVMYVPRTDSDFDTTSSGKRSGLEGVFATGSQSGTTATDSTGGSEASYLAPRTSIFERPGFGSVAFRNSITAQLSALPKEERAGRNDGAVDDSIGSAGSLVHRHGSNSAGDDSDDLESEEDDGGFTPLHFFMAANGLQEWVDTLIKEKIDLDSLVLLTETDLQGLGFPLGPRRKLTKAIIERRNALEDPGDVEDSHL